jgi:hypothetical protein
MISMSFTGNGAKRGYLLQGPSESIRDSRPLVAAKRTVVAIYLVSADHLNEGGDWRGSSEVARG